MYPHEQPLSQQQEAYLKKLYYEKQFLFGRDRLFSVVQEQKEVPRIYRAQLAKWLKQQKTHQITTKPPKETSTRPRRASKSSNLQMDLLDMTGRPYRGFNYVLVVVDIFSRYAWVFPIKTKSVNEIKPKVASIIQKYPNFKVIQSDQGTEFKFSLPGVKRIYSSY